MRPVFRNFGTGECEDVIDYELFPGRFANRFFEEIVVSNIFGKLPKQRAFFCKVAWLCKIAKVYSATLQKLALLLQMFPGSFSRTTGKLMSF